LLKVRSRREGDKMKKSEFIERENEFIEIERNYHKVRKRFESINEGDLVWKVITRGLLDTDYHPAVVKEVNVDDTYLEVIDISSQNEEKRYEDFLTESEFMGLGISKKIIEEEYKKYEGVINRIKIDRIKKMDKIFKIELK
jgi:hypothetical protein